ncbi:hypothetical protein NZA98_33460, partial [Escherichia coli]|nr:hypothetical protein [Escherichia coli]
IQRKLVCFRLDDPLPVYGGEAMIASGRSIGMTTSGDYSHTTGASLVFGYLAGDDMALTEIDVEAFGRRSRAIRVERCIYDPTGERIRQ